MPLPAGLPPSCAQWKQMQADLLDIPVRRPKIIETTARGAAYLAGLASGVWKSIDSLKSQWTIDRTLEPSINPEKRKEIETRSTNAG